MVDNLATKKEDNNQNDRLPNRGRRQILKYAVATAASALLPDIGEAKPTNAFETLSQFKFKDQKGDIIDGSALKDMLAGSEFTISSSLNGCDSGLCTPLNENIRRISEALPAMKHLVINADPAVEGASQEMRDAFKASVSHDRIPDKNLIILYPLSLDDIIDIQGTLGNVFVNKEKNHPANVRIYDGDGNPFDCIFANELLNRDFISSIGNTRSEACR